jgi:hypothetical protein
MSEQQTGSQSDGSAKKSVLQYWYIGLPILVIAVAWGWFLISANYPVRGKYETDLQELVAKVDTNRLEHFGESVESARLRRAQGEMTSMEFRGNEVTITRFARPKTIKYSMSNDVIVLDIPQQINIPLEGRCVHVQSDGSLRVWDLTLHKKDGR